MKRNKKFIFFLIAVFSLSSPFSTLAYTLDFPAPPDFSPFDLNIDVNEILQEVNETGTSSVTSLIEDRYGITEDIWRNAERKVTAPRVEIFFDTSNPKPGEKVTAHAVPEFFKNDPQNLYYTWYIIHTRNGTPMTATNTVIEGKREASRIMARGDYDPDLDGQTYDDPDKDPDKDGWPSIDSNSYDEDDSSAPVGGADGVGQNCFRHLFGTSMTEESVADSSGTDTAISCDHKWKDAESSCTADDCESGSGKFPTGEEKYWKTDPSDPDTDGDGFVDEADVVGLGQDTFTWTYQSGDRVGVVIEGTSMIPVDETNAYYKIMWGYLDICDSTKASLLENDECNDSEDHGYGFLATKSPSEQGEEKLKLSLSFTPDNPLADPSPENNENIADDGTISDADQITVTSSIDNTEYNPNELYYTWQISEGDIEEDDWKEIKDIAENFNTTSPASGMGISQFSFTPKKGTLSSSGMNYFKVTLTASKASGVKEGRGRSSVIIPVNTQGVKISLHKVDIVGGKAAVGEEVCAEGLYKSLCPAVKGQMLAARVSGSHYKSSESQFSWTLNGMPVYPPANDSQLFEGWNNTTVFFPITKEEQGIENISVTTTSRDELQPASGARLATVVRPAAFIKSGDTSLSWPKIYTTPDPARKDTYRSIESSDAFEALTSSNVPYYLDFVPYYLVGEDENSAIDWSINGTSVFEPDLYTNNPSQGIISLENENKTIILPTSGVEGYFMTLTATVNKYWSEDERIIPYTAWGVVPNTLSGESSISIQTVNAVPDESISAAKNPDQILAAIGTHLPHYFMYLLRLVLTITVMFAVSSILYGFSQNMRIFQDEK